MWSTFSSLNPSLTGAERPAGSFLPPPALHRAPQPQANAANYRKTHSQPTGECLESERKRGSKDVQSPFLFILTKFKQWALGVE